MFLGMFVSDTKPGTGVFLVFGTLLCAIEVLGLGTTFF